MQPAANYSATYVKLQTPEISGMYRQTGAQHGSPTMYLGGFESGNEQELHSATNPAAGTFPSNFFSEAYLRNNREESCYVQQKIQGNIHLSSAPLVVT